MVEHDWIYSYRTIKGMQKILYQMDKRTKNQSNMQYAHIDLQEHYDILQEDFEVFFEQLQTYSSNLINI